MRSKRSHRIALLISGTIGFVAFFFVVVEYLKIRTFKNALSELIESKTHGEFELIIDKSDINLRTLEFRLENIQIKKKEDHAPAKGIRSVNIPLIHANFGSLKSFFKVGQVTIENLMIAEPSIEIIAKEGTSRGQLNVAQTLIRIFPAVESVMDRFNVQSVRISRGDLKIEKNNSELLHLKLIDFLVKDWNMRQLSSKGRLQLNIQAQKVDLNKSSFSFSEVEYKYPEHYLIFKDFAFESADSVTNSKIAVNGKSVLINQLDYNELYYNQRFKLRKLEIIEPHITGRLSTDKTSRKDSDPYQHPLMDIMKQTFGEVDLDSAVIKDAQTNLMFVIKNDSLKSSLDDIDITLHAFKVIKDSSRFQIGEILFDFHGTELKLNDNVNFSFSKISMGEHRSFTISDARLSSVTGQEFVECDRIHMENFRILNFIFDKKILAHSVELENANITVTPDYLKLFPIPPERSGRKVSPYIKSLALRNVNLNYRDNNNEIKLKGIDATVQDIKEFSLKVTPHQLSLLKVKSINANLKNTGSTVHAGGLDLTEQIASVQTLDLDIDSFHMAFTGVRAIPTFDGDLSRINEHHWGKIEIDDATATGEIPGEKNSKNQDTAMTTVNDFSIAHLTSKLRQNKTGIAFQVEDLSGKELIFDNHEILFKELIARIYNFEKSGDRQIQIDSIIVDSKSKTAAHQARYLDRDLSISAPYLEIGEFNGTGDLKSIPRLYAKNIGVFHASGDSLAFVDSLFLSGLHITSEHEPVATEIEVFNPVVRLEQNEEDEKPIDVDLIKKFSIHNATLRLPQRNIAIHGNLSGELENGNYHIVSDQLELKSSKSTITVSGLNLLQDEVFIEHLNFAPNPRYYGKITEQTDVISGDLRKIRFKNLQLDSAMNLKMIRSDSIYLDDFSVHIKRDKRLPDPPMLEKPVTLDELLYKGKIDTDGIVIKNGDITYEEVSARTANTGRIEIDGIQATVGRRVNEAKTLSLQASARLYGKAPVAVQYNTIDSSSFNLVVNIEPFDMKILNSMILPLESLEIKSGHLDKYQLSIDANRLFAEGRALMTYEKLHLNIFKRDEPEKKNVGSELSTLVADGLVIRHNRDNATATVKQLRIPQKSIFNYWVKSAIRGSLNVVRHSKKKNRRVE
ncbi:MAG TPA: hypothetical protein VFW11_15905 [Cyclobacteriaceae bacterium]|nr:hypothetical protein [Cyclobacteriaceae bacterium]